MKDKVSHAYRATGKTMDLCISMFKFLERRREDE
jgi:hypothetical protein